MVVASVLSATIADSGVRTTYAGNDYNLQNASGASPAMGSVLTSGGVRLLGLGGKR